MSESFEHALMAHPTQPVNWMEFRSLWAPHWYSVCSTGHVVFPEKANQAVPNHVVVCLMTQNVVLGRELLGISGHNQLIAVANDAMAKFNKKATSIDTNAHKVLSALNECINTGRYA